VTTNTTVAIQTVETNEQFQRPITARALLVAVIVTIAVLAWVEYSELVTPTSQMSESTPPIPAILALGAVWALVWLWRKAMQAVEQVPLSTLAALGRLGRRLGLKRAEVLVVYLFLIVSCAMPSVGVVRLILPCLMELQYFQEPSNNFAQMSKQIPRTWAPLEGEPVRTFWEGVDRSVPPSAAAKVPLIGPVLEGLRQFFAQTSAVPWRRWATPFVLWNLYLMSYFAGSFCLVCLFRKKWVEDDHLAFPLATMSIEMVRGGQPSGTDRAFFRNPVMWVGFGLAVLYNATNMLKVFNPGLPAMGMFYPIGRLFTEFPWNRMAGLAAWYKPEIMGLGYLVPSEILFSIMFFSLAQWFVRPLAAIAGYQAAGFPWPRTQAAGALIVLGLFFTYQARHRLVQIARKAFGAAPEVNDSDEPLPYRLAFFGTLISLVILVAFPVAYGVDWWAAGGYFLVGTLFLIAYCRNRAETGLPIVWGYPLLAQKDVLTDFLGSRPFIEPGRIKSFSLLSMLVFFERGTYYAITSTEQEACIVGDTVGLTARRTAKVVLIAMVIGFASSMWMYLSSYYTWGGNIMETVGGTQGGQRAQIAMRQFLKASAWIDVPSPPNLNAISATLFGAVLTSALVLTRYKLMRFPFHAVGYALACCHTNYMWFPALVIFSVKTLVMRTGGMKLYRRLAPGFIAFTLGHFTSIGLWSFAGLYAGEYVQRYRVWFL